LLSNKILLSSIYFVQEFLYLIVTDSANLTLFLFEVTISSVIVFFFIHYANKFLFEKSSNAFLVSNIGSKTVGFKN
jgi:hypothetical protein